MRKEIKEIREGVVRITTLDERWYSREVKNKETGLPEIVFVPSATRIAGCYPKGIGFWKWLANTGWDESQRIMHERGDAGSKIHQATEDVDKGLEVTMESKYFNPSTQEEEELALDEYDTLLSFCAWVDETKPELLASELTVYGENYAGTLDRIYRIDGVIWIVDIKTSQYIWESHKLQLSSYSHADIDYKSLGITEDEWKGRKLGVLRIGYRHNKRRYKLDEVEDKYEMFKVAYKIWENENPNDKPFQKDYPLKIISKVRCKNG